jgi:hypothetical protein
VLHKSKIELSFLIAYPDLQGLHQRSRTQIPTSVEDHGKGIPVCHILCSEVKGAMPDERVRIRAPAYVRP